MPLVVTTGPGGKDIRTVIYLGAMGVTYSLVTYGGQNFCLAGADVDDTQDTELISHADVSRIPDDLAQKVSVQAVQDELEAVQIPANWVSASNSYRELLRIITGMFNFLQRFRTISGITTPLIDGTTVTLSTRFNQLPQAVRTALVATATDMGFSTTGLSGNNTLRTMLKLMADQWGDRSFTVGDITV